MSDTKANQPVRERSTLSSAIIQIKLAASFLTILPIIADTSMPSAVAASFAWFPLVGFLIGAALILEDWLLSLFLANFVCSILTILTLTLISGALHLDGLADAADSLGAGRDRTRALEIMRDSRIGNFGAVAIFFVLALKVGAIAFAAQRAGRFALLVGPGLARWAMVAVPQSLPYLRQQGAGSALLGDDDNRNFRIASVIALLGVLPLGPAVGLRAIVFAIVVVLLLRAFYRRWFGGVTGDLIGAAGEIVEASVMVAIAGRS